MADRAGTTVLLVEDDDDNRELMTEVLEAAGYRVIGFRTGAEALRALEQQRVDAVVTDIGIPGVSGIEVARAAKRLDPGLPVLVVTGYSEREDIDSALERREIDRVLVKPVDPDHLAQAVADVLRPVAG